MWGPPVYLQSPPPTPACGAGPGAAPRAGMGEPRGEVGITDPTPRKGCPERGQAHPPSQEGRACSRALGQHSPSLLVETGQHGCARRHFRLPGWAAPGDLPLTPAVFVWGGGHPGQGRGHADSSVTSTLVSSPVTVTCDPQGLGRRSAGDGRLPGGHWMEGRGCVGSTPIS